MLLQRLSEYADRMHLPPPLYSESVVRYIIDLDGDGRLLNRGPIDTIDPANLRTKRGLRRLLPLIQRTVGIKALLLADNAEYTFGLARPDSKAARVAACHAAYMDLLDRCVAATGEPAVRAVQRFLHSDPVAQLALPDDYDRGATVMFNVDGKFPVDLPSVQAFWAAENDPGSRADGPAPVMQCLICGQERPVLTRLQAKIKRVPGGQTSGTSIISANAEAFESYGLENSLIAPTCASCGERFTKAINELLEGEQSRLIIGGMAFVFWTREPVPDLDWFGMFSKPEPAQVRALLEAVRTGRDRSDLDTTPFYGIALSGSGGRVVVRDWIDTTVGEARRHLSAWFAAQRIVESDGSDGRPYGLTALAGGTVRELRDLSPQTPRTLLRAALTGAPLPPGLLYEAVRRNRAEQGVTRQRAALIKLVLRSRHDAEEEDRMIELDPNEPRAAYRCGRLFAVLEEAQRLAVPGIKATIGDRFYGAASTAPVAVFARLLGGAKAHLAKLERDRPGAYHGLQARIEEIMGGLSLKDGGMGFPRTLTLEQQALFALGYYHQRAFDRAQAREASARRKAGEAQGADPLTAPAESSLPVDAAEL